MAHVNYTELARRVGNFESYTHGSSHAIRSGDTYTIVSYSTPIAVAELQDGKFVCRMLNRKFSTTTSRLQNIIRKEWKFEDFTEVDSL